jgi:hypothetical protein
LIVTGNLGLEIVAIHPDSGELMGVNNMAPAIFRPIALHAGREGPLRVGKGLVQVLSLPPTTTAF